VINKDTEMSASNPFQQQTAYSIWFYKFNYHYPAT